MQWYRAFVEAVVDKGSAREAARVYFMDFGNTEVVQVCAWPSSCPTTGV